MSKQQVDQTQIAVDVKNIGGIAETSVEFSPGVTVLVGSNATNRTSFLQAIMAGLGSENATLKGDAKEGSVELTIDGQTYRRNLSRRNNTIQFAGEPYLADGKLADLFAFLLESNEARRAVERGDDLYDLIMRPVDTDEIDAEIDRLESEREELKRKIDEIDDLERQLPGLEEKRTKLLEELEETQAELEAKEAELEELETPAEASEAEATFEELRETRRELESRRADIDDEERVLEALQEDRSELQAKLDGLAEVEDGALEQLDETISRHRSSIQSIESTISEFQSVIQFNESMLEGAASEITEIFHEVDDGGAVTDQLVADTQEVVCWTCGSQVESNQIEKTIDLLQDAHGQKVQMRNKLRDEIEELEAERTHIERSKEERLRLKQQLNEVRADVDERTDRIENLKTEVDELEARVETLEDEAESVATDDRNERLDLHREVNELEVDMDRIESELADVENEIDEIEGRLAERDSLESRRGEIDDEIEELRARIERLETESVEQFNDQMDQVLDLLEFENLERVWIERIETEVNEGRRKVTKPTFDLHVVRTAESGSVYEDTVEHLSESEREVVGLVLALAGNLVHEVYEQVPFLLLDSLEALDSGRISVLIDHLAKHSENILVALLPEDAAAVDESYERINEL